MAHGFDTEGRRPVVVNDGQADVSVGVDVRVYRAVMLPHPPL